MNPQAINYYANYRPFYLARRLLNVSNIFEFPLTLPLKFVRLNKGYSIRIER